MMENNLYDDVLDDYEEVLGSRSFDTMSPEEVMALENDMYAKGIAFTEVQKLCRASSKTRRSKPLSLSFSE